jgi:hypothetical protein
MSLGNTTSQRRGAFSQVGTLNTPTGNTFQRPSFSTTNTNITVGAQIPPGNGLNGILSSISTTRTAPGALSANPLFNQNTPGGGFNNFSGSLGSTESGLFSLKGVTLPTQTPGGTFQSPSLMQDPLGLGSLTSFLTPTQSPNPTLTQTMPNNTLLMQQAQKKANDKLKEVLISALKKRKDRADAAKAEKARQEAAEKEAERQAEQKRQQEAAARQAEIDKAQAQAAQAKADAEKAKADAEAARRAAEDAKKQPPPPPPPPATVEPAQIQPQQQGVPAREPEKPVEPPPPDLPKLTDLPDLPKPDASQVPTAQVGFGSASAKR